MTLGPLDLVVAFAAGATLGLLLAALADGPAPTATAVPETDHVKG